jgi:hypothetical protein
MGAWDADIYVVPGPNVAIVSGTFTQGAFSRSEWSAVAWLTGNVDTGAGGGIQQSVATILGQAYDLSFFLGAVDNPGGFVGTTNSVSVLINGSSVGTFTTPPAPGASKQFTDLLGRLKFDDEVLEWLREARLSTPHLPEHLEPCASTQHLSSGRFGEPVGVRANADARRGAK